MEEGPPPLRTSDTGAAAASVCEGWPRNPGWEEDWRRRRMNCSGVARARRNVLQSRGCRIAEKIATLPTSNVNMARAGGGGGMRVRPQCHGCIISLEDLEDTRACCS